MGIMTTYYVSIMVQSIVAIFIAFVIGRLIKRKNPDLKPWVPAVLAALMIGYIIYIGVTGVESYFAAAFNRVTNASTEIVVIDESGERHTIEEGDAGMAALQQRAKGMYPKEEYEGIEMEKAYELLFYEEDSEALDAGVYRILGDWEVKSSEEGVVSISDGERRVLAGEDQGEFYVIVIRDKTVMVVGESYLETLRKTVSQ